MQVQAIPISPSRRRAPFRVVRRGDVLHLEGEFDIAGVPALERALRRCEELVGSRPLTVDLSALGFMDCATLGVLVAARARGRDAGRHVVIAPGTGAPARLLALCGIVEGGEPAG